MTRFSRRNLLRGAGVVALLGASWAIYQPTRSPHSDVRNILAKNFSEELLTTEAAQDFISDYATLHGWSRGLTTSPPDIDDLAENVLISFFQSTTVLLHLRRGDNFMYLGLFDPFTTPCLSQLNAII